MAGPGTSATRIELTWQPATTEAELGGVVGEATITSYRLDWDAGTSNWAPLAGESSGYQGTSFTTDPDEPAQVLVAGTTYRFKLSAQNEQGWGPAVGPVEVLAASVPSQMAMVTVADIADVSSILIDWAAPAANGSPISAYEIRILTSTVGVYVEALSDCNGAAADAILYTQCVVPMTTLVAAPFLLQLGDPIVAIAKARNAIDWALLDSSPNDGMSVKVQQAPAAPPTAPVAPAKSESALTLEMPEQPVALAGGSAITSYNLQYDQGGPPGTNTPGPAQDSDFISLVGEVPAANSATLSVPLGGLTTNTIYTFRYRVKNKHGWSAFSSRLQALTATAPDAMLPPTISYSVSTPTSVTVTWAAPYSGGNPISAYRILFQHTE